RLEIRDRGLGVDRIPRPNTQSPIATFMRSRRHFLQLSFVALLASAARVVFTQAEPPHAPPAATPEPAPTPTVGVLEMAHASRQVLLPLTLVSTAPVEALAVSTVAQANKQIYVPLIQTSAPPLVGAPLLAPASGSAEQAIAWLSARAAYTSDDVVK